jgi:AcrR family transcriptional regulator
MPRSVEPTTTKERIVAAALTLFRERGIAGVSTRDVGEAAGLARSHLYHYYADWPALRNGVFAELAAGEIKQMSDAIAVLPPVDALALFVHETLPASRDSSWILWLDAWDEALRDDAFAEIYLSAMAHWERVLSTLVARGVAARVFKCDSPERTAKQLFALINGYTADLLLKPSRSAQRAAVRDVTAVAALLLKAKL